MTQNSSLHLLVYITCASTDNAREIAHALVEEQLAACVSILPAVQSIYRWQNNIESSEEILLMVKTHQATLSVLQERVCNLHPYELPEIIAVPIVAGLEPYLNWITESVTHHA